MGLREVAAVLGAVSMVVGVPSSSGREPDRQDCLGPTSRAITYLGVTYDQTDFDQGGMGAAGFWFAQFGAHEPVTQRPTGENARDSLPSWAGPLSHFPEDPDFAARTFSQDGPARSEGGQARWNRFTLPDGEAGLSGAIVDPKTAGSTNNTINRIQLGAEVPATFYLHVVTDNTGNEHDPTQLVRARGNAGPIDADDTQVEADTWPEGADLVFNGTADVYTFRYDGFVAGDYLKLRLRGDPSPAAGASFAGLLFDEHFAGDPAPPHNTCRDDPAGPPGAEVLDSSPEPAAPLDPADAAQPQPGAPAFTG